jgi:hypothetical protein
MTHVGMLCNVELDVDPREQLSPSVVNRACLVDDLLAPDDIRLFLYCPRDVTADGEVPGYMLEKRVPVALRAPVPRVNANWSYRTRQLLKSGMGYQSFKRWMRDQGNAVYVPYEFAELVANKLASFELVREWDEQLHPWTEAFLASRAQIESFLARSETVFIKPRAGHKGNRIFVIRRSGDACALHYYDSKERRSFPRLSYAASVALIEAAASREPYIVQQGIETFRPDGAVFDARVMMAHDGHGWDALIEGRLSPPGSDLSNVFQGGTVHQIETLLAGVVGDDESRLIQERIQTAAHGLAGLLESRFPGALSEIGFDFVLGTDLRPHLVEINAKPGIAGIASESRYSEWTLEEQALHSMWTLPQMNRLARFLRLKVASA